MDMLIAGTIGFFMAPMIYWSLLVALFIVLVVLEERELITGGTFVALVILWVASQPYGGIAAIFAAIKTSPIWIAVGFVAFIAAGVVWAFFKWSLYVGDAVKVFQYLKVEFMGLSKIETESEILVPAFIEWLNRRSTYSAINISKLEDVIPSATTKKKKITSWIMLWPASAVWFLVNDPVRRAAEWVFEKIKGAFEAIAKRAFGKAFSGIGK
jgi:hypothetical protein